MTDQEVFDTVARHLLTQKARASDAQYEEKAWSACVYRHSSGRKCAVGVLIPDDKYCADMEGRAPDNSSTTGLKIRDAAGLTDDQVRLALSCQTVHDTRPVSDWRQQLRLVAFAHGLSPAVLAEFAND